MSNDLSLRITLEAKSFQDALPIDLLLYTHTCHREHCQTTVAQLLRCHIVKFLSISGLQSEWVKAAVGNNNNNNDDNEEEEDERGRNCTPRISYLHITRVIVFPEREQWAKARLYPAFGCSQCLDDVNGKEEWEKHSSWDFWNLIISDGMVNVHPVSNCRC